MTAEGVKRTVLLAEDDVLLASLIGTRLEKSGYRVLLAADVQDVRQFLSVSTPDIFVSHMRMPYFSGIELIDYVGSKLLSTVPVIITSSSGNEENVLTAFELEANDFIAKPFSPSELLVRVGLELTKT